MSDDYFLETSKANLNLYSDFVSIAVVPIRIVECVSQGKSVLPGSLHLIP